MENRSIMELGVFQILVRLFVALKVLLWELQFIYVIF